MSTTRSNSKSGLSGLIRHDVAPAHAPETVNAFLQEEVRRLRSKRNALLNEIDTTHAANLEDLKAARLEIVRLRDIIRHIADIGNDSELSDDVARKRMHDLAYGELSGEPDRVG